MKPPPVVIIVDTREQLPYDFAGVETIRACLPSGDYSVQNYETVAAVERKTLADLVQSLSHGRERFEREMERLKEYEFKILMIDATLEDIAKHRYQSQMHPSAVVGSLAAFMLDYQIQVVFAGKREYAELLTLRLLTKFWERKQKAAWPVVDMGVMDEISRRVK